MEFTLITSFYTPQEEVPLGVYYISAYLQSRGYPCRVVPLGGAINGWENMDEASLLKRSVEEVEKTDPNVLGISCGSDSFPFIAELIKAYKKRNPDVIICLGGHHPTFLAAEIMSLLPEVDVIVRGEGEITFFELVDTLSKKEPLKDVLGITYRNGDKIYSNPDRPRIEDLDLLPFPNLPDYNTLKSFNPHTKSPLMVHIEGGRGCMFSCPYCSESAFWGKQRKRSPERVVEELALRVSMYGESVAISFVDDEIAVNKKWLEELCTLISKQGWDISLGAFCRIDFMSEHILDLMAAANFDGLFFGIESISPSIRRVIKRAPIKVSDIFATAKSCLNRGTHPVMSFMSGFPGETEEEMLADLDCRHALAAMGCDTRYGPLIVLPGTQFWSQREDLTILPDKLIAGNILSGWGLPFFVSKYEDKKWCAPYRYVFNSVGMSIERYVQLVKTSCQIGEFNGWEFI